MRTETDIIIEGLQAKIQSYQGKVDILTATLQMFQQDNLPEESPVAALPSLSIREGIYRSLKAVGKPLRREVVYEDVLDMGIQVTGKNPMSNLSAHMSLDARIESVGGGLWGLYEWRQNSDTQVLFPNGKEDKGDERYGPN